MKKIFILVILFIILSCDNNDDIQSNEQYINGKWNLTRIMNTSVGGSMPPDINDTHFYQINKDGTFERISLKDDNSEELIGTYILTDENIHYGNEDNSIQKFIELSYSSEAIFFNCGALDENKQLLILTSDYKLQNNLSGACDAENYEYTKEN